MSQVSGGAVEELCRRVGVPRRVSCFMRSTVRYGALAPVIPCRDRYPVPLVKGGSVWVYFI